MGGGRSRKRAAESSQDGTGSASGSFEELDINMSASASASASASTAAAGAGPGGAAGTDVPEDLREFGLWTDGDVLALVNAVGRSGRLKATDMSRDSQPGLRGKAPHEVETLVTRLRGALSTQSGWRRGCDGADSRGASLAALASELGHARRQRAEGTAILSALQKTKQDFESLSSQMSAQTSYTRRITAQVPEEAEKTRRAARRRSDLESAITATKRSIEQIHEEHQTLKSELAAISLNKLEARRRLDRTMLKISATRGQMSCPTVMDEIPNDDEIKLDEDVASTEMRLLRNRLDMHLTEAVDWQKSYQAIQIQTTYAQRATTLLNFEIERANGNAKHSRSRAIQVANPNANNIANNNTDNDNNSSLVVNKRPTKKPRKSAPRRSVVPKVAVPVPVPAPAEPEKMTDIDSSAGVGADSNAGTSSAVDNTAPVTATAGANAFSNANANADSSAAPNSSAPNATAETAQPYSANAPTTSNVTKETAPEPASEPASASFATAAPEKAVKTAAQQPTLVQADAS